MLIAKIVSEIDAQLQKLSAAREAIATVYGVNEKQPRRARKPETAMLVPLTEADTAEPEPTVVTGRVAARAPRERRMLKRGKPIEPNALASKVPSGAVFVSSSEVARRAEAKAAAVVAKPPTELHPVESGFDALVREAAARSRMVIQ